MESVNFSAHHQQELQKMSVVKYFSENPVEWQRVVSFINSGGAASRVSLRLLDHFVTCYARKHVCEYKNKDGSKIFNVYHNMQTTLIGLQKKRLDPFRRKHTASGSGTFEFGGITTNVSQMSFFRWAIINGVLDYVEQHAEKIRHDMASVMMGGTALPAPAAVLAITLPASAIALPASAALMTVPSVATSVPSVAGSGLDEIEKKRAQITLAERMQKPRKKRKRLGDASLLQSSKEVMQNRVLSHVAQVPVIEFASVKG